MWFWGKKKCEQNGMRTSKLKKRRRRAERTRACKDARLAANSEESSFQRRIRSLGLNGQGTATISTEPATLGLAAAALSAGVGEGQGRPTDKPTSAAIPFGAEMPGILKNVSAEVPDTSQQFSKVKRPF